MAVMRVNSRYLTDAEEFTGLSTDTKPTLGDDNNTLSAGASFIELDTKAVYIFDGISTWYPL